MRRVRFAVLAPLALLALVALLGWLFLQDAGERQAARPAPPTAGPATAEAPRPTSGTLVFLGDSLTAGLGLPADQAFPALIEARLAAAGRPWTVINAGVSGDTTAGGAARLDWLYRRHVDVLFVCLGANDGLRGLPVADTERNLRTILDRARKEGSRVVLAGLQLPENYGREYRAAFAQVYPRLAREYGVPLLPFLLQGVALDPRFNQADGIHPNAEGARRVADQVWTVLDPVLREPT